MSCIFLLPFPIHLHHSIEIDYIDVNIAMEALSDSEGNLMITTDKLPSTTGKGRIITLWILSCLVALAFIAAGGAKLTGGAAMVEAFDNLTLVRRAAGHRRRQRLIKEGHRKVAKIEQPRFDSIALLEVLKNPLRRLFGKPALTRGADDTEIVVISWSFAG